MALRWVPACPRPCESKASSVAMTPASPRSAEWLDAVAQPSHPDLAKAPTTSEGAPKVGKPE